MTANCQCSTHDPSRIGELLVRGEFISRRQLRKALSIAELQKQPLCSVLMRQRRIGRLEKDALLNLQHKLRQPGDTATTTELGCRLGDLIMADGRISRQELEEALAEQRKSKRPLGSILLQAHNVSVARLTTYLRLQQKLLTAAAMALAAMSPSYAAEPRAQEAAWGSLGAEKPHASPHSLSANWRRPSLADSLSPRRFAKEDEIFRSRGGKMVLRLTETGVEFRKFF